MAKEERKKDIIIIGGGVAGLTSALYAGRMNLSVLLLEAELVGGQIVNAYSIENYPGFASIQGDKLVETIQQQAESFGAVVDEFDKIIAVDFKAKPKIVETENFVYKVDAVIVASGMTRRKLALKEVDRYLGKGVHYCELCDGHMYQGKTIAVVGGGNAAVDAANFLMKYAKKLYVIHRDGAFNADEISQKRLRENPAAEVLFYTEIKELKGHPALASLLLYNNKTGETTELRTDALFVYIGLLPNTAMFKDLLKLDETGRIVAGEDCQTNIPGVFAAGDVRTKPIRQLTTAAADGTVAALLAEKYLQSLKEET